MANILTPITLWKDFDISLPLDESVIKELKLGGIRYTEVYFSGRETGGGRTRVYGLCARADDNIERPWLLILPDYDKSVDMELAAHYAKKGYNILTIDYSGEHPDRERCTKYPKAVSYANYLQSGRRLWHADDTAKETAWYEWVSAARYAVKYLQSAHSAKKIGVLGIRHGGEVMWQLIACQSGLDCAVTLFGIGWAAYKGMFKFDGETDIAFDDERHRFIAAAEAHAYAPYAKCPVMVLTSTNDRDFDADRAFDTLMRVNSQVLTVGNFSVRYDGFLGSNSLNNIDIFFAKYLKDEETSIPRHIDISIELEKGEYVIKTRFAEPEQVSEYEVYYSDGTVSPALRDWTLAREKSNAADGKRTFAMQLCKDSGYIFAFAKAKYKNGFALSSKIASTKIEKEASNLYAKSRIIFSCKGGYDGFTVIKPTNLVADILFEAGEHPIKIIDGPFNINGIYSKFGLKTYRVGSKRYGAEDNYALKMDVYSKAYIILNIRVTVDSLSDSAKTYFAEVSLHGGEVWQNICLESKDFKTPTGQPLKSFKGIDSLAFESGGEFALNNIIWL